MCGKRQHLATYHGHWHHRIMIAIVIVLEIVVVVAVVINIIIIGVIIIGVIIIGVIIIIIIIVIVVIAIIISEFKKRLQLRLRLWQRVRYKTIGCNEQTNDLHVRYNFWYISLPYSAKQQREMTKFKLCRVCGTHDGEFSILCLNLNAIPTNYVPR